MPDQWKFIQTLPGSLTSITVAMLAFAKAESIYIFEHRKTGQRVRVYARSMAEAGEKLADGNYSKDG